MIIINVLIKVEHHHDGELIEHRDEDAYIHQDPAYTRIVYQEEKAEVIMDLTEHSVMIRRQGETISQILLEKAGKGTLSVMNELGRLNFDAQVHQFTQDESSLSVHYDLIHEGVKVGSHRYLCTWEWRD